MLVVFVLVYLFSGNEAKFYNETANTTDLSRCSVHYSRSESVYKDFYEISNEARPNGTLLDFHFSVLASSDAHILLSPTTKLDKTDPAYEIVLGAGGNRFSDIRRQQKSEVKESVRIKNLLNALDPQPFWIHISKDGLIEVGRGGEELAFISWRDPNPLPIKYFSFGTWPGAEAKWYFDCPREDNTTGDSKEVQRQLTHVDRLRRDLLTLNNPYVLPVLDPLHITTVEMKLTLYYLSLNEFKSVMSVKGQMMLNWTDEKLKWDPMDYGNVTVLHVVGREVWQPDLVLHNAADIIGRDILDQTIMTVTNQGRVEWNPLTRMNTWCDVSDLGYWPRDIYKCDLLLGFSTNADNLDLQFTSGTNKIINMCNSDCYNSKHTRGNAKLFNTDWRVFEVAVEAINTNKLESPRYTRNYQAPLLKITLSIERSSKLYNAVFFAPFLVIAVSMLATFCVSPHGCLKISFGCLQLVVTSLVMVSLAVYIPSHAAKVPYLVNLYSYCFIASLVSILITILVVNLSRTQYKTTMPFRVATILTSSAVQTIFLLPKYNKSENYGKLDEAMTSVKSDDPLLNIWSLLGIIIDRISFVVYFIIIIYAIIASY